MRVELLKSIDVEGRRFPAGPALLPDKIAKKLISKGDAEAMTDAETKPKKGKK